MVTVDQVLTSLRTVVDPELHKDIVSMGMIKDLAIAEGKVSFNLELTTPACPFNSEIEQDVRTAISNIGVENLDLKVTARVMEGRAISMDELIPEVKNIIAVAGQGRCRQDNHCCKFGTGIGKKRSEGWAVGCRYLRTKCPSYARS